MSYPVNEIICGDCLEVMQEIPDKSIDMILCDLPYGITACKWDVVIPFEPLWEQYKRIIKDRGAIVLTASQPFTSMLVMSNPKWFKYEWIWAKSRCSNFLNSKKQPLKQHENILIFSKGNTSYFPQGLLRLCSDNSRPAKRKVGSSVYGKQREHEKSDYVNYPKSILSINNPKNKELDSPHPTQKPVALFEYLIKTYTNPGDTVLDNCAGSGTTAIACLNTDRNYICIEKEEKYCDIACSRAGASHFLMAGT